jgi:hypothetical protein
MARGEPPRAAFDAEVPSARVAELLERVRNLAREARLRPPPLKVLRAPRYAGPVKERTLTAAEVHGVFARVWGSAPSQVPREGRAARRRVEWAKALRHDPNDLSARLVEVSLARPRAGRGCRRPASCGGPPRGGAFLARRRAGGRRGRTGAALERAAQLAGDDSHLLNEIAWRHVEDGRGPSALPLAMRALRKSP